MDTHGVGTEEDSGIRPLALVKAGVVHNPLSGQCERLEGSKRNKDSKVLKKTAEDYRAQNAFKQNQVKHKG